MVDYTDTYYDSAETDTTAKTFHSVSYFATSNTQSRSYDVDAFATTGKLAKGSDYRTVCIITPGETDSFMLRSLPVNPGTSIYAEQLKFWTSQVQLGYYRELTDEIDVAWYKANDPKTLVTIGGSATGWHYYVPYPIMVQYGHWLSNIFTKWDWGTSTSLSIGKSAMVIEMTNLPATIKLNVISIFISIPAGIGLGIWAALKKNKAADNIISTIIMPQKVRRKTIISVAFSGKLFSNAVNIFLRFASVSAKRKNAP